MDASSWKYVENTFAAAFRRGREIANKVIRDHVDKLTAAVAAPGADPRLAPLLARLTPIVDAWGKEYDEWQNMQANYGGSTVSFESLLSVLSTKPGLEQASKIEEWDSRIRAVVPKGSSVYVTLLPRGRAPFTEGRRDTIVEEVKNLGKRLSDQASQPALVALGGEVTDFYNTLKKARSKQQGMEGGTDTEADELAPALANAATVLYGNLGALMDIYQTNPVMIAGFFDLETLRARPAKKAEDPATPPG